MPAAQTHLRGAGRIGAFAGPPRRITGGGQQLWPVADGGDIYARASNACTSLITCLFVQTQIPGARPPGITARVNPRPSPRQNRFRVKRCPAFRWWVWGSTKSWIAVIT